MKFDVKVPAVGESITEATIGAWLKKNGELVKRNDALMSLETDKATVEIVAEQDGTLQILAEAGSTIPIGAIVAHIDSEAQPTTTSASVAPVKAPGTTTTSMDSSSPKTDISKTAAEKTLHPDLKNHQSPAVQRIAVERGLDVPTLVQNNVGTGRDGRLTKADIIAFRPSSPTATSPAFPNAPLSGMIEKAKPSTLQGTQKRVPMTTIRRRIAERLIYSQQSTATLTTFNEINMARINELRHKYKDRFKEKYGVSLGFMGLFLKASIEALQVFPAVNAFIDGNDIIYNNFYNIGVAVSTEKGLIVPVIRDVDVMSIAEIEITIRNYALKARDGKIEVSDLTGGTFTISNGGVFGSLMSTPILNPPQSAILGMHKTEDRPVAVNGRVEICPMMYVALSYDHRLIDGREAVGFLVKIKEGIEDPERLLLGV